MEVQHPLDTLLREIPRESVRCVLDLGSGSGSSALHLHRALPSARVFAFECDPQAVAACRATLSETTVTLVPVAVGSCNASLSLHLGGTNGASASLLAPIANRSNRTVEVLCTRLESWCTANGVSPDIVWGDVEGDPLSPIRGLGSVLASVLGIYLPILYRPTYVGQPSFGDIDTFLRSAGFRRVDHVQSLPGHWGFAVYVNTRLIARPAQLIAPDPTSDPRPFARGGLGDLLQYVTAAREARSIRAYSHYDHAPAFFAHLGVKAELIPFQTNTAFISWADAGTELVRDYFPCLPVPPPVIPVSEAKNRVVGIHPMGSGYSNTFAQRFSAPAKWMSPTFIEALVEHLRNAFDHILVFCSPNEAHFIPELFKSTMAPYTLVALPSAWSCLSMVQACGAVIGVDSSIKTMSGMLRIPTVTLVGDYDEPFRDRHFLQPYVQARLMRTVRYKHLGAPEAHAAAEALVALLSAPRR